MSARSCRRRETEYPECPRCSSQDLWRRGFNSAGTRQWTCKSCGRAFVVDPYISSDIKTIADRMILAGVAVPTVAEVLQGYVSRRWLYDRRKAINV